MSALLIDKNASDERNTAAKIIWWIMGTVTGILVLSLAAWGATMSNRQSLLDERQIQLTERLSRIEGKIDMLIEQIRTKQER